MTTETASTPYCFVKKLHIKLVSNRYHHPLEKPIRLTSAVQALLDGKICLILKGQLSVIR
jgi:hypothetical protein